MLHSNLVYNFKHNICNDIYHGTIKRHFKVRACEHLGITPLTGKMFCISFACMASLTSRYSLIIQISQLRKFVKNGQKQH